MPSNGEANSAEISVEIPNGTGDISLSIHKAGSSNHILGPNGWQSADYWFNGVPSEMSNNNVAWFCLPAQLVEHITYSNYSVFCRRVGNSTNTRTILTGGALAAKPLHTHAPKGNIELPPLPADFSQEALGSLAAVDKTPESVEEVQAVLKAPAEVPEDHATHSASLTDYTSQPAPVPVPVPKATSEVDALQPEVLATSVSEPEVPATTTKPISTPPEGQPSPAFDAPMTKQAPFSTTQKPLTNSNMPIFLGVLAAILLAFAFYFFGFRDSPSNDGASNAQPTAPGKKPETPSAPPVQKAPEPEPTKPAAPAPAPAPENKVTKPSAPEVKQPPKKSPISTPVEPASPAPAPAPEKAQPPAPSVPDLNRMVNEALKR